jgi:hypothetical protein
MKDDAIALQQLFQIWLGRPVEIRIMEDNAATIAASYKGYSPSLRHLPRMNRTSIGFLYDCLTQVADKENGKIEMLKVETDLHKGDMFTKQLVVAKFLAAMQLINMKDRKSTISQNKA